MAKTHKKKTGKIAALNGDGDKENYQSGGDDSEVELAQLVDPLECDKNGSRNSSSSKRSAASRRNVSDSEDDYDGPSTSKRSRKSQEKKGKTATNAKSGNGIRGKGKRKGGSHKAAAAAAASVPPTNTADEEEYEVEKILNTKVDHGKNYYLVRWKGYSEADDTWEAETDLSCPDLIANFLKRTTSAPNKKPGAIKGGKKQAPVTKAAAKANNNNTAVAPKNKRKLTKDVVSTQATLAAAAVAAVAAVAAAAAAEESDESEYEVEKILDYNDGKDGRKYLIRWKGYKAEHDTWEPETNLNCADLINKFNEKIDKKKELREAPKQVVLHHSKTGRTSKRSSVQKRIHYDDDSE